MFISDKETLASRMPTAPTSLRDVTPLSFILCFSLSDMLPLLDIKPDGGTRIYSVCEAFNDEMEIPVAEDDAGDPAIIFCNRISSPMS